MLGSAVYNFVVLAVPILTNSTCVLSDKMNSCLYSICFYFKLVCLIMHTDTLSTTMQQTSGSQDILDIVVFDLLHLR